MGGSQSTPSRKLTIPNEDSNIIKVSESVAERLKKCMEKSPDEFLAENEKPPPPECPPTEFQKAVSNKENIPYYPGDPLLNFYYGPSVTSIRMLQAKENELKESEDYWSNRVQNIQKHHESLSIILENEYNKAVDEISNQSPRPPPDTPFPCCEQKQKLLECYRKNPKEALLCAGEVTNFADCVHLQRITPEEQENCDEKDDKKDKKDKDKNEKNEKNEKNKKKK